MKRCRNCDSPAGPRTKLFCDYHAGYNAGHSVAFMRYHRENSATYRDAERKAVKKRMRRLRSDPKYVRPEKRDVG